MVGVIAGIMVGGLGVEQVCAQSAQTTPPDRSREDLSPEARANAIRREIVEDFGTEEQVYAFDHPGTPLKPPGYPKGYPKGFPLVVKQQPEDVYIQVFTRLMAEGLGGLDFRESARGRTIMKQALWHLMGQVPYLQDIMRLGPSSKSAADDSADRMAKAGLENARVIVKLVLNPEETAQYDSDGYMAKSAKLFKAIAMVMENQEFPGPFVVYFCDVYGIKGGRGEEARSELRKMFPDDPRFSAAVWNDSSQVQKWRFVTDALKGFFREGASALADLALAERFAAKLYANSGRPPAFPGQEPLGKQEYDDKNILETFGSSALAESRRNPELRKELEQTALVMRTGAWFMYWVLIGESKPGTPFAH
jgi:hypothetical protein